MLDLLDDAPVTILSYTRHPSHQQVVGKPLLHVLISGGNLPSFLKDNVDAISVVRLARWLRWLACSLLPDVFATVRE